MRNFELIGRPKQVASLCSNLFGRAFGSRHPRATNNFQDIVGYFSNHRPKSEFAKINNEAKVQDILYCLLRPILADLQYEDPQGKNVGAIKSTRVDLISKSEKIFIEAKHASSRH